MWSIFRDGLFILDIYKEGIAFFFVAILGYGFLTIKHLTPGEMDTRIKLLAALGVGSIVLCVLTGTVILLAHFWPPLLRPGSLAILLFAIFVLLKGLWSGELRVDFDIRIILAGIALFLLLVVRLSFLKHIILPPYSDSPIHYQIVLGFLHPDAANNSKLSLDNVFNNYYHFGFHGLVTWLTAVTEYAPADVISLLGQIFLVLAPLSVLLLTYVITGDANGAWFAGLLAAIGWMMPAFAVNWGKFPALASLAVMPAIMAFPGLHDPAKSRKLSVLVGGLVLLTGIALIHTRIIVCIVFAAAGFFLANKVQIEEKVGPARAIRLSLFSLLSLWPLSPLLAAFYRDFPVLIVFLVHLPFAFQEYPRLCMGIFFYIFGLWLIVLAPTLLNENARTLLDRQFLEIMLYIPFSVIGGAGFAGALKKLPSSRTLRSLAMIGLAGSVIINSLWNHSADPDRCCDYFKEGDRLALQWIRENSSEHTLVLIAAFNDDGKIVGTDSGIWIHPLIGQSTNKLPFNTNWKTPETIEEICRLGAGKIYIYMGGRQYSFDNVQLLQEKWLAPVFTAGETVVYQASECP